MNYDVYKVIDGEEYYEGTGDLEYVNKMIKLYSFEREILIKVKEA